MDSNGAPQVENPASRARGERETMLTDPSSVDDLLRSVHAVLEMPDTLSGEATIDLTPDTEPRTTGPIRVSHEGVLEGHIAFALWDAYEKNYGSLRELAVMRHVYPRKHVLALLANPQIVKIVAWQGAEPVGLAMVTNNLDSVIEISPQFLRARYPEHAARDAIYVGMLVMVTHPLRGLTVFSRLSNELWQVAALANGVLVYDVCEFNRTLFDVDTTSQRIADNFPQSKLQVLDRQTWYVAELPEPFPTPVRSRALPG